MPLRNNKADQQNALWPLPSMFTTVGKWRQGKASKDYAVCWRLIFQVCAILKTASTLHYLINFYLFSADCCKPWKTLSKGKSTGRKARENMEPMPSAGKHRTHAKRGKIWKPQNTANSPNLCQAHGNLQPAPSTGNIKTVPSDEKFCFNLQLIVSVRFRPAIYCWAYLL